MCDIKQINNGGYINRQYIQNMTQYKVIMQYSYKAALNEAYQQAV